MLEILQVTKFTLIGSFWPEERYIWLTSDYRTDSAQRGCKSSPLPALKQRRGDWFLLESASPGGEENQQWRKEGAARARGVIIF